MSRLHTNQSRDCVGVRDGGESSSNKLRDGTTTFGQCRLPQSGRRDIFKRAARHSSLLGVHLRFEPIGRSTRRRFTVEAS